MAGDERGDELFEDLDKFFAPIRDVDWDEPEEQATQAPQEEHVAVRTEPTTPIQVPEEPVVLDAGSGDDEDAWYDTDSSKRSMRPSASRCTIPTHRRRSW